MIDSGILPVVRLQEIFRQSMQSLIVSNAHRIVCGEMPELADRSNDFFFLKEGSSAAISSTIVNLCAHRLPKTYGYSPMNDIQVLCPGRKGDLGVVELNKQLQQELNPPHRSKREIVIHGVLLRERDKVMQVKNDYDITWTKEDGSTGTGVYNGDVGILEIADRAAGTIVVRYEDREAVYTMESAENLSLAYAMTVHKSQGNEFDAVVMPMYPGPPMLYFRNLLYTAVTRAKKLLILVGYPSVVKTMVENNKKTRRYSGLKYFLAGNEEEFSEDREQ
jgi:exodeoxyribonuclease V alpha subunit